MIQARMSYAYRQRTMLSKSTIAMRMTRRKGSGKFKAEALERDQQCPKSAKNITCREV